MTETQYLPPVSAFVMMRSFPAIAIDGEEDFKKSTTRNRCIIIGANGPLTLTVPVKGGRGVRDKTKYIRISNEDKWQHRHWRSILSAYGKSSYFIFYEEKLRRLYEKRFEYLIDFNTKLMGVCFEILQWRKEIVLNPKRNDHQDVLQSGNGIVQNIALKRYYQVFESRLGFIANVSIVDLLFNSGNEAEAYLEKCHPDFDHITIPEKHQDMEDRSVAGKT